jgi:cardiolipin synthase
MSTHDPALQTGIADTRRVVQDAATDITVVDMVANNLGLVAGALAVVYITAVICAVREIMYSRTSQGSVAWLLSLFFIPYVTVPLYFVFGWRSFSDYAKIQITLWPQRRARRADELGLTDHDETRDWPVLSRVAGSAVSCRQHKSELLIDGDATFTAIKDGIARAETSSSFSSSQYTMMPLAAKWPMR